MSVLSIQHVYKSFKDIQAVRDLSLELPAGTIFGLLGPNGAGKTTTIRMIMDIIIPDQGEILINGQRNSQEQLDGVGYLPEERGLYRKMKVGELLSFLAEMKGLKPARSKERIVTWLKRFDLLEWQHKKLEALSKGMQQKVQFIATILHEPKLIILDEPFTGLDPINSDLIKDIMLERKNSGATIIFSTHMMEQVEKLCDAICLIDKGKAVLSGELRAIKKNFSQNTIRMEYEGLANFLQNERLVKSYQTNGNAVEIHPQEKVSLQEILRAAIQEVNITRFEIIEPSLHEIFVETVTKRQEEA